jgi:protein-tyrosine phosphatase
MRLNIYWIENSIYRGRLGIMARPRGGEWLEDEIQNLRTKEIGLVVSLLTPEEIEELELKSEKIICERNMIEYINFPIPDRQFPDNKKTDTLVHLLEKKLSDGKSIVIHCRMGIGRASIIAGALMLPTGLDSQRILQIISAARGLQVPDTPEQSAWLAERQRLAGGTSKRNS